MSRRVIRLVVDIAIESDTEAGFAYTKRNLMEDMIWTHEEGLFSGNYSIVGVTEIDPIPLDRLATAVERIAKILGTAE